MITRADKLIIQANARRQGRAAGLNRKSSIIQTVSGVDHRKERTARFDFDGQSMFDQMPEAAKGQLLRHSFQLIATFRQKAFQTKHIIALSRPGKGLSQQRYRLLPGLIHTEPLILVCFKTLAPIKFSELEKSSVSLIKT